MNMKIKEEDKNLNYWEKNCEEDYLHTPISVLRYITKLEEAVNNCVLDGVNHQRGLLESFRDWHNNTKIADNNIHNGDLDDFLEDYNCG